mmetsp:Transcript_15513/g.33455  ORF Transcript_15513/g.33455 Transcript_15513/m.33455 type:complete len:201 (+) Transcript_15513:1831-2433(+)
MAANAEPDVVFDLAEPTMPVPAGPPLGSFSCSFARFADEIGTGSGCSLAPAAVFDLRFCPNSPVAVLPPLPLPPPPSPNTSSAIVGAAAEPVPLFFDKSSIVVRDVARPRARAELAPLLPLLFSVAEGASESVRDPFRDSLDRTALPSALLFCRGPSENFRKLEDLERALLPALLPPEDCLVLLFVAPAPLPVSSVTTSP